MVPGVRISFVFALLFVCPAVGGEGPRRGIWCGIAEQVAAGSMADADLHALFMRAKGGDQAAANQLFEYLNPKLSAVIFNIIRSEEETPEVLSQLHLRLFRSANFEDPNKMNLPYLLTSVRNLSLNHLRHMIRAKRREVTEGRLGDEENPVLASARDPRADADPTRVPQIAEQLAKVKEGIDRLLPRQREALLLFIDGMSYEQIADKMGGDTTAKTVKSLISRARANLKTEFFGPEPGGEDPYLFR